jgi:hypothetical protein
LASNYSSQRAADLEGANQIGGHITTLKQASGFDVVELGHFDLGLPFWYRISRV